MENLIKFVTNLFTLNTLPYGQEFAPETHNTGVNFEKLNLGVKPNAENFVTNEKKEAPAKSAEEIAAEEAAKKAAEGTKTPEEIAAEKAAAEATGTPEVQEVEVTGEITKEQAVELTKDLADDDEVETPDGKKMSKKEFLATFEKAPEIVADFKIGDKDYTEDEYQKIVTEFLDKNKLDPDYLDKTTPSLLKQQLKTFLNLKEGNKSINERNQDLSRQKKDLIERSEQVQEMFTEASATLEALKKEKDEVSKRIKSNEEIESLEFAEQATAKVRNEIAQDKVKELENQILNKEKIVQNVKDNAVRNAYNLCFTVIQTEIPELQLDKHPLQIIRDDEDGIETDEQKIMKANIVYELANDAMREVNKRKELKEPLESFIVKYYNRNKWRYGNFESTAQPVKENKVNPPVSKEDAIKSHILKIKKAQDSNVPPVKDTNASPNLKPDEAKKFDTLTRNRDEMIRKTLKIDPGAYPRF